MTFDLIRLCLPNTAAILALAMMPLVALATMGDRRATAVQAEQVEPAAICLTLEECGVIAAAEAPPTILQ